MIKMPNHTPITIDYNLVTTLALIILGSDLDTDDFRLQISDYVLLANWLDVKKEVSTEGLAPIHRANSTGLGMVMAGITHKYGTENSNTYIAIHLSIYHQLYEKEFYYDYQLFKRLI